MIQKLWAWIGQKYLHIIAYLVILLLAVGAPYKLFVKDTNKTQYQAPVTQNHQDIKVYPGGCARFEMPEKHK